MPSFDYLLRFVEKHLKLISHPLRQNDISNIKSKYDVNQTRVRLAKISKIA